MAETHTEHVTVIKPTRGWGALGLRDVWGYRDLLGFFFWREVKGSYRQMALGPLWIILKPLAAMVIFSVIFGRLARISTNGLPGPLFYYTGILPWYLFSGAVQGSANGLVSNMNLISKVYFPRLIVPIYSVCAGLLDFAISFAILLIMMLAYSQTPTVGILLLPLYILLALATALATGLLLAGLSVRFRDVSFALGYMMQLWMYASPVIYPMNKVPERWLPFYRLNPMANVVEGFRWAFFGPAYGQGPDAMLALVSGLVAVALIFGAYYFRRVERTIVDLV